MGLPRPWSVLLVILKPMLASIFLPEVPDLEEDQDLTDRANSALGGFLSVSGIIFGLLFAHIYSSAQARLDQLDVHIADEAGGLHRIVMHMTGLTNSKPHLSVLREKVGAYAYHLQEEMSMSKTISNCRHKLQSLYELIPEMAVLTEDGVGDAIDKIIVEQIVSLIDVIASARYQRVLLAKRKIPVALWIFMVVLAYVMFMGILLINSGTLQLDLLLCGLTVVPITYGLHTLSDMNEASGGQFRIDDDLIYELCHELDPKRASNFVFTPVNAFSAPVVEERVASGTELQLN